MDIIGRDKITQGGIILIFHRDQLDSKPAEKIEPLVGAFGKIDASQIKPYIAQIKQKPGINRASADS